MKQAPDVCPSCGGNIIELPPRTDRVTSRKWYRCEKCEDAFPTDKRHDTRLSTLRNKLFQILGGAKCVCNNPSCFHGNSICKIHDVRCLQFDHIDGAGYRKRFGKDYNKKNPSRDFYKFYVNNHDLAIKELQVFCANCNWIKREIKKECSRDMKMRV